MNIRSLLKRYTVDQLQEAIRLSAIASRAEALEAKKNALLKQVARIERRLESLDSKGKISPVRRKPRKAWKLSAETRRKMSEAAKRRYSHSTTPMPIASGSTIQAKRTVSTETRKKMAEAARQRWARAKASTQNECNNLLGFRMGPIGSGWASQELE